jgi:hypothetical protein
MELQCKIEVDAAKEKIWPYYVDPSKRSVWEMPCAFWIRGRKR